MSDFSEWGGGGGVSTAINDLNTMSQTNARDALLPGQLAAQPVDLAHTQALTRRLDSQTMSEPAHMLNTLAQANLHMEQAGLAKQGREQTERLVVDMKKWAADQQAGIDAGKPPPSLTEATTSMAMMAAGAGAPKAALDLLHLGSQNYGHDNTRFLNKLKAEEQQHKTEQAEMDWFERTVRQVNNDKDWEDARAAFSLKFGQPAPFGNLPFTPELRDKVADLTLTHKQKLDQDFKQQRQDDLQAARDARNQLGQAQLRVREQAAQLAEEKFKSTVKSGGKLTGEPSKQSLEAVRSLVKEDNPKALSADNLDTTNIFIRDVASEAKNLRLTNPAIKPGVAESMAYQKMKDSLNIVEGEDKTFLGVPYGKKPNKAEYDPLANSTPPEPGKRVVGKTEFTNAQGTYVWTKVGDKAGWKLKAAQ